MVAVTASSVLLVSAPGTVMVGVLWNLFTVSDIVIAVTYSTTGVNSLVVTIINYSFRNDYRNQLLVCCNFVRLKTVYKTHPRNIFTVKGAVTAFNCYHCHV